MFRICYHAFIYPDSFIQVRRALVAIKKGVTEEADTWTLLDTFRRLVRHISGFSSMYILETCGGDDCSG